jgi:hypothetical protein
LRALPRGDKLVLAGVGGIIQRSGSGSTARVGVATPPDQDAAEGRARVDA